MEPILSTRNNRVKEWAALKQKKYREANGRFLIEGVRLVEEALESGAQIDAVLLQDDLLPTGKLDRIVNAANSLQTELVEVNELVIGHIADTRTPQGVIAIGRFLAHDMQGIVENKANPLYLIADRIQDPGNLGTIIRSADAVNATAVFIGNDSVDLYNPKVVRATMGSLFHLPVVETDLRELINLLKQNGVRVVGTQADTGESLYAADFSVGTAIVIGSEAHGISEEIRQEINTFVSLPMPGKAESLNAAIAASVILYEALRQRTVSE